MLYQNHQHLQHSNKLRQHTVHICPLYIRYTRTISTSSTATSCSNTLCTFLSAIYTLHQNHQHHQHSNKLLQHTVHISVRYIYATPEPSAPPAQQQVAPTYCAHFCPLYIRYTREFRAVILNARAQYIKQHFILFIACTDDGPIEPETCSS